jgi:hypothetical protein
LYKPLSPAIHMMMALSVTVCSACGDKEPAPDDATDSGAAVDPEPDPEPDADGDGYVAQSLGGDDCNDDDPTIHPGAPDAWYDGIDSDCAGNDDYDSDGDGYGADEYAGPDCDDTDPTIQPYSDEDCADGRDDDCDSLIDCEDAECANFEGCFEICTNEIDDNDDGLVDCDQPECMGTPSCPVFNVQLSGGQFQSLTKPWLSTMLASYMYARSLSGSVVAATSAGGTTSCVFSDVNASWGKSSALPIWPRGFSGITTGDCGAELEDLIPREMARSGSNYRGYHDFERPWWRPSVSSIGSSEAGWFSNRTLIRSSDNLHVSTQIGYDMSWWWWSGTRTRTWSLDGEQHMLGDSL